MEFAEIWAVSLLELCFRKRNLRSMTRLDGKKTEGRETSE